MVTSFASPMDTTPNRRNVGTNCVLSGPEPCPSKESQGKRTVAHLPGRTEKVDLYDEFCLSHAGVLRLHEQVLFWHR